MICVTSGIKGDWGKIESWPNMFGEFEDAWSIRNVWGRAWHQNLRRCLTAPGGKVFSLIFGSSPKLGRVPRLIRRYFLVFSAFGVSGLLHSLAVYYGSKTDTMPYEDSTPLHMRPGCGPMDSSPTCVSWLPKDLGRRTGLCSYSSFYQ
ncbi:hypothetical protein TWF191_001661 [Orbilia oligospora]|uniref:Wax synthase domain-containing protein n=1 Tax=Orbilia oligospora TaxID=2813651 RepID=A0A7C8VB55_ORBOL|nr:hypothetical protein TWF191_001661 [Orbilia oligospora]